VTCDRRKLITPTVMIRFYIRLLLCPFCSFLSDITFCTRSFFILKACHVTPYVCGLYLVFCCFIKTCNLKKGPQQSLKVQLMPRLNKTPTIPIKVTALLVGGSRDRSPVVSLGIFFVATDGTMCPGVDSPSKNEYQHIAGGKDGLCVGVTNLPPSQCPKVEKIRNPKGLLRPVVRKLYLYL
jgi:hypothetical protein